MDKAAMRKAYKAKRAQISPEALEDLSLAIANKTLTMPIWEKQFYHIFLPIERLREINTEYILHILQGKDKNIVLSRCEMKTLEMLHYLLQDNTELKTNSYGIVEPTGGIAITPSQIDVVFIPLLAYDTNGNRIGYGAGFYDRFLAQCKPETVKIGLSLFEPELKIEQGPHDVRLDFCVTPKKVYTF